MKIKTVILPTYTMPQEVKFFKQDILIECSLCRERVVACFHELKCANFDILNSSTFMQ